MLRSETLPVSFAAVLQVLRPCFTAPSFRTFTALTVGLIGQTGRRTVTGMLTAAGLAGIWHHSRAYWFFTGARWCTDQLGLALVTLIRDRLLTADAAIMIAVDDSLFRRSGRTVFGTGWHHDPTSPAPRKSCAWGNNWVVAGIIVWLPFLSRPICLPVLFRLWRKGDRAKAQLARDLTELITAACPGRTIHVVADGLYGTRHWRKLDPRITLTAALRANAALSEIHTPVPGANGRPKHIGDKIGTPAQLAARGDWQTVTVTRYGSTGHTQIIEHRCLWVGPLRTQHVRVILTRDPDPRRPKQLYDLAILTTDLTTPAAQIIERYAARWPIEVTFHDAKHITGVGQARTRTETSVRRTVPLGLLTHTLVIVWYALAGHEPGDIDHRRRAAPWYTTKTEPSYEDMLIKLRRTLIAARFHPGTPRTPTTEETLAVHQAWANTAA
jgi:hypothetical protein